MARESELTSLPEQEGNLLGDSVSYHKQNAPAMNRDPFNLRRGSPASQLLRGGIASATQATQRIVATAESLVENGRAVYTQHGTSFTSTSSNGTHDSTMNGYGLPPSGNAADAQVWQSSGRSRFQHNTNEPTYGNRSGQSFGDKVTDMFTGQRRDSLPMYKDKPHGYGSRRSFAKRLPPWARKRRFIGPALAVLAFLSWWLGILSPLAWFSSSSSGHVDTPKKTNWALFGGKSVNWEDRAARVKDAFQISWAGYEKYGWGYDEYHPVSHSGKFMTPKGLGWIVIDALDTMMIMNLSTELTHARQWINTNLTYDQDHDVNTFETTIRMLGGLLSAHYLSTTFPDNYAPVKDELSDDLYIEKATDLAERLLGAYETNSGVPLASVNLHTMKGIPSHADGGASSTAEATSLQLEMKYLAKLTGETHYWEHAEKVIKVVDDNEVPDGLVPIFIYADAGTFRGDNIRLGSRGDSYYEYLIKQYFQTSQEEPIYQAMWNESLVGIKKHLITYSYPNNWTVLAERPSGLNRELSPKMDHLVCFLPGTIALATTGGRTILNAKKAGNWGPRQDEDMNLARELMKTCMGMYRTETGLAPEIANFHIHDPPLMYNDFKPDALPRSPATWTKCADTACTVEAEVGKDDFFFKPADVHNLQRPETVESLFYLWRITGDEQYRTWGWEMFQSFVEHTATDDGEGFSSVSNVRHIPPPMRDNMESFWLAETLKYFYLLFSPDDILPLTDVVFNTEAHPFPRFSMGKLFKTGWTRKKDRKRDEPTKEEERRDAVPPAAGAPVSTIRVTQTIIREAATATATGDA